MKGLIAGVIAISLGVGSALAIASTEPDRKMRLKTHQGHTVKVILPGSEAHKLRGTMRRGDDFRLYQRAPDLNKRIYND